MKTKAKSSSKNGEKKAKTSAAKDIPPRKNPYGGAKNPSAISPQRPDL